MALALETQDHHYVVAALEACLEEYTLYMQGHTQADQHELDLGGSIPTDSDEDEGLRQQRKQYIAGLLQQWSQVSESLQQSELSELKDIFLASLLRNLFSEVSVRTYDLPERYLARIDVYKMALAAIGFGEDMINWPPFGDEPIG